MAKVGKDEWVATVDERTEEATGLRGRARRAWYATPPGIRLAPFVVAAAMLPFITNSEYIVRISLDTLVFVLLCLGLNITAGWAGLLDLGYIAFFGFGAYMYAFLASDHFDIHWPTIVVLPIATAATVALGFLLGLPSRRLTGDYLAIVTLFFAQIFVLLTLNGNRIALPGSDQPTDVTGGPNGITDLDPFEFLGVTFDGFESYYWFTLLAVVVVGVMLWFVNGSRTGRAWRSVREDALAAEVLSVPVNRLKLFAFAFGAGIAGFTGTIFAAVQTGVFPQNFDLALLITVYAMLILGGAGSLVGAALGAIIINAILEVLSTPEQATFVFFVGIGLALLVYVRPWWRLGLIAGGTVVFGIVAYQLADALRPAWTSGTIEGGRFSDLLSGWVIHPAYPEQLGKYAFVALIACVIVLSQWRSFWGRTLLLIPTLYLAAMAWEDILVENPSVTRLILLGASLVVLMTRRPEGILGQKRVEIV